MSVKFDGRRVAVALILGLALNAANVRAAVTPWVPIDSARLLIDGPALEGEIVSLAQGARERLDVQFMIFAGDEHGWVVAQALMAAAARGVRVRVLIDSYYLHTLWVRSPASLRLTSNKPQPGSEGPRMIDAMRRAGVEVKASNTFHRGNGILQRNHRKLVVADGRRVMVTGYQPSNEQYGWHDVGVAAEGNAIAAQLEAAFEGCWTHQGDSSAAGEESDGGETPSANRARLDMSDPSRGDADSIRRTNIAMIDSAHDHVYIENSYFADSAVFAALRHAARRGVDVRAIFNANSNIRSAEGAGRAAYKKLLAAGVRVYERSGMFHTKALSVDGVRGSVGSGNMFRMTEESQNELNMEFEGALVGEFEKALFARDFATSQEITPEGLNRKLNVRAKNAAFSIDNRAVGRIEQGEEGLKNRLREAGLAIKSRVSDSPASPDVPQPQFDSREGGL